MATFGDAMDRAAAAMNDANKRTYTFAVQLPYMKMAWDNLEGYLIANDISIIKEKSAVLPYVANAASVVLPNDFFLPLKVYERPEDSTSDDDWNLLERSEWDKDQSAIDHLAVWAWREQTLYVNLCNQNRDVKLFYMKDLSAILTGDTITISVDNSMNFLAFKCAYYMCKFLSHNEEKADSVSYDAAEALDLVLTPQIKSNQHRSARRRPYRARKKM